MESGKHKPIRMCVVCRNRFYQDTLYRLQCVNKKLIKWQGRGRSFYVCKNCVNDKKFTKYIVKLCKVSKKEAENQIFSIFHFTL